MAMTAEALTKKRSKQADDEAPTPLEAALLARLPGAPAAHAPPVRPRSERSGAAAGVTLAVRPRPPCRRQATSSTARQAAPQRDAWAAPTRGRTLLLIHSQPIADVVEETRPEALRGRRILFLFLVQSLLGVRLARFQLLSPAARAMGGEPTRAQP